MQEEEITPTFKELLPPSRKTPVTKTIPKKIIKKTPPKKTEYKKIPISEEKVRRLKPGYKYAGKETLNETIEKFIPKQFVPTSRFASILGLIFLAIVILALIQFPFGKLLSGDLSVVTKVGYPWTFLELSLKSAADSPLKPLGLFLDMILYLIISYGIDVIINIISDTRLIKSEKEKREHTKIFKNKKPTVADKIIKKIFN